VQTVSEESEAMTTVNMDEPLPAIALDEPELGNDSPRWELMLFRGDPGVKAHMKTMTLAHLVQVLAALTGEQLRAVATHELLEAPISDLAREELEPLRDSYDRQHEAEKQRDQEKARADRAEQALANLRQIHENTMAAHEEQAKLAHSRGCEIERAWEAASKAGLPYAESLAALIEDMARKLKEAEER
jgi:hypothetical protein